VGISNIAPAAMAWWLNLSKAWLPPPRGWNHHTRLKIQRGDPGGRGQARN